MVLPVRPVAMPTSSSPTPQWLIHDPSVPTPPLLTSKDDPPTGHRTAAPPTSPSPIAITEEARQHDARGKPAIPTSSSALIEPTSPSPIAITEDNRQDDARGKPPILSSSSVLAAWRPPQLRCPVLSFRTTLTPNDTHLCPVPFLPRRRPSAPPATQIVATLPVRDSAPTRLPSCIHSTTPRLVAARVLSCGYLDSDLERLPICHRN